MKVWWRIWNTFVRRVVPNGLSSCRPVANETRKTTHCGAAYYRDVTLSLGSNRTIAFLYIYISQVIRRQRAARLRAVWSASLATERQCDNAPFVASDKTTIRKGNNDMGCVVAIDNAMRKVYQIIHYMKRFFYNLHCIKKKPFSMEADFVLCAWRCR
jgi:hypothetical protein